MGQAAHSDEMAGKGTGHKIEMQTKVCGARSKGQVPLSIAFLHLLKLQKTHQLLTQSARTAPDRLAVKLPSLCYSQVCTLGWPLQQCGDRCSRCMAHSQLRVVQQQVGHRGAAATGMSPGHLQLRWVPIEMQ